MAPSASSAVDPKNGRAMGSTEENWTRATATGTGVQVLGIALKKSVDIAIISEAVRQVMAQHAVLRSQIVEISKGKLGYQCIDQKSAPSVEEFPWPSVEKIRSPVAGALPLPGDDTDNHKLSLVLRTIMIEELNTPFRNADKKVTGPVDVFTVHVYTEAPSRQKTILILKFNSGAVDRPSAVTVTQSFLASLNAAVGGQAPQLPESPDKIVILPSFEDLVPKGKATKSLIQKGIDTVSYAMGANKSNLFPFSPGYTEVKNATFRTEVLSYTLGKEGTAALVARSQKEKTSYSSALSAAFLKGVADVKELKDKKLDKFSFTNLMDCRRYFEPPVSHLGVGNYTAGISQFEQVKSDRDLWELARSISESAGKEIGKLRHFSELPVLNMLFSQILKRPSLTQKSSLRTALFSLFMDGPLNAQWTNVNNLELAGSMGPFASMHGIGPCFCVAEALIPGPELTVSLVFATPVYNRDQIESLASNSLSILAKAINA